MSAPTNRKPPQPKDAPQEPFKRAVASCMRALSRNPALEVTYSADRPSLIGAQATAKARLPEPPRKLTAREAAIVRGHADSLALRLACHDNDIHRRLAPDAQAAWQARLSEAFGAGAELVIDALTLLRQDGERPFRAIARLPFAG